MKIKLRKTYSYYEYSQEERDEMLAMYNDHFKGVFGDKKPKGKDYGKTDEVDVTIVSVNDYGVVGETEVGQSIFIDLKKEARNMVKLGYPEPEIEPGDRISVIITRDSRGNYNGSLSASYEISLKSELMRGISDNSLAYNVKILEICPGGFMVNLSGVKCFLPGSLAATNRIYNFADYVGKVIPVMVETYDEARDIFVVSFKKYLKNIIGSKVEEIEIGAKFSGTVTGTSSQGVFVEWDEIFTGLIPQSEIAEGTRFASGSKVEFYVCDTKNPHRLGLSFNPPSPKSMFLQELKTQSLTEDSYTHAKECKIVKIKGSGAILKIEDTEQSAFIDKRDLMKSIKDLKVGDIITCYPVSVNVSEGKISMKQFEKNI
jgi:ribosomal protein S1